MRSGNNIHVQQHKTIMINEEWNKTQNDAPFVAFYDMRVVTFVLPDEMAVVSIAGLQWFILIPRLKHTRSPRPADSHSKLYLHREKNIGFGTRTNQRAAILQITGISKYKYSVVQQTAKRCGPQCAAYCNAHCKKKICVRQRLPNSGLKI